MNLIDLITMSVNNLVRRKVRTLLTVLGVVIGASSIVVMISLGMGMQQSVIKSAEESGGLTTITVTSKTQTEPSKSNSKPVKHLNDEALQKISQLDKVKTAAPILTANVLLQKGKYQAQLTLTGMKEDALKALNLPLASGQLPSTDKKQLDLLVGNMVAMNFQEKGREPDMEMYFSDDMGMELGAVDFDKDRFFMSLTDAAASSSTGEGESTGGLQVVQAQTAPSKQLVRASGQLQGGPSDWKTYSNNVYVNLESLLHLLKTQSKNGVLPGQPTTKGGKPYRYLTYSSVMVQAESVDDVDTVMQSIKSLGYSVSSNMEMINSSKQQFATIQMVLGAIGSVSLLVAAIGITNTMMMSIYERTKEIGVIKVLGCSLKNIQSMFLIEAALIGLFGGTLGNLLSYIVSFAINSLAGGLGGEIGVSGNLSFIPLWLVGVSIIFSMLMGMVAGFFPAKRAMQLSPLVAING